MLFVKLKCEVIRDHFIFGMSWNYKEDLEISWEHSEDESETEESEEWFDEETCFNENENPVEICLYFLEKKLPENYDGEFIAWFMSSFRDIFAESKQAALYTLMKIIYETQIDVFPPEVVRAVFNETYYIEHKCLAFETLNAMIYVNPQIIDGREEFFLTVLQMSIDDSTMNSRKEIWELMATVIAKRPDIEPDQEQIAALLNTYDCLRAGEKKALLHMAISMIYHPDKSIAKSAYHLFREQLLEIIESWSEIYVSESILITLRAVVDFKDDHEILLMIIDEWFDIEDLVELFFWLN